MYNNLENLHYHTKEDCVFNTECLLVPNNYSFMNFRRPDKHGNFYSQVAPKVCNSNKCKKINCKCVSCYNN